MSVDSMVLEEELDSSYEATDEEVAEYAMWLGFDLLHEKQLLWIAREGLKAELPAQWKPCRTEEDEIYYFNFDTGESTWDHPCDDFYRKLYKEEALKLSNQRKIQQLQASSRAEQVRLNAANKVGNGAVAGNDSNKNSFHVSECKDLVPVTNIVEEKPGRLVVRWKSALSDVTDRDQKRAQLKEKMKLKIDDGEPLDKGNASPTQIPVIELTPVSSEHKNPTQRSLQQGQDYQNQRQEMIEQVERRIEIEKKLLHERDAKQLERELDRERQFLDIQEMQRKRATEAKRQLDAEAYRKKEEELISRKQKRVDEFKSMVSEELDSFEKSRRERLQEYRENLLDKEIQMMQLERDEMSRRVSKAVEGYEGVVTQELRTKMLERAKQDVAETEEASFASEFQAVIERVGKSVQLEAEKLQKELQQQTEAEMAGLKRSLLKHKREEMLLQVETVDAELRAEMERMETIIREAYERKSVRTENGGDRSRTPDDIESVNHFQANGAFTNALQKAACEVLLNMVVKGRADHKEEKCCEEKFSEIKHWMDGFEKKMRTLMVTIEDTRDSFAGYRTHSDRRRRSSCACDANVLMCEAFQPFCHGSGVIGAAGCSNSQARSSNVNISLKPKRPSPTCSCEYYGGPGVYSKPRNTVEHWKVDVETDSDAGRVSDRAHSSRMGRHKREKALKCKKKVKHSLQTRAAVAGKRCTGEDPGVQQKSGERANFGNLGAPAIYDEQDVASNLDDEPGGLSLSNSACSSSGSGEGEVKKRGRLNRLRKGLFVVKGKFLKWSAARASANATGTSTATTTRGVRGVRKADIAKLQLECRKKLRQLPIGLRWKVTKLVRRSPRSNGFYASADEWPNLESESSPDFLNDIPPV